MERQKPEKHLRKRKKKLLNSIREQIEFYFSSANLRHDRFMRQLIGCEDNELKGRQFVDLNEFFKFNKISDLTENIRDLSLAIESSKCLALDQKQLKVRRIEPFVDNDLNYDESTIYVERLPPNADQQWVRSVFGAFGAIQYVKVPHFRHNHNIMGFAFVEFEAPEAAQKAVKHFSRLASVDHKNENQMDTTSATDQTIDANESEAKTSAEGLGKRTHETSDEEVVESKRSKICSESDLEVNHEMNESICGTNKKKKKKRRRKRKVVAMGTTEDIESNEVNNLRVMSKKEWKSWKNKYLKLQKQTMSSIKRSLLANTEDTTKEESAGSAGQANKGNDTSFESGLIIKLNFKVPSNEFNDNEFKRNIRLMAERHVISYIDLPNNGFEFKDDQTIEGICYVRTDSGEECKRLVANERFKQLGESTVLDGKEESDYWNRIFEQRMQKKSNMSNNTKNRNKIRGFDRIINRAENVMTSAKTSAKTKPNTHIKFDNVE